MLYGLTMIIACPACATRYVVPDSAIGVEGRTVRCAKCRHSWFQDGPQLEVRQAAAPAEPAIVAPPAPPPAPEPVSEPAPSPDPEPEPVAETEPALLADAPPPPEPGIFREPEPAAVADAPFLPQPEPVDQPEPVAEPEPAPQPETPRPADPAPTLDRSEDFAPPPIYNAPVQGRYADDQSSFAHEPPFRPRRNPARMWTMAAALFAVMSLGAIGATAWYGLPDWLPFARPTFAEVQPGLQLDFPPKRQERRQLPDGSYYFSVNGTITNVGSEERSVPSVLVVLRGARDRIVYSRELVPPQRVLAPGESVDINEALTDVPRSARIVTEIGWKPG